MIAIFEKLTTYIVDKFILEEVLAEPMKSTYQNV
jgi:hypothetical protein